MSSLVSPPAAPARQRLWMLIVLSSLMSFAAVSTDLYLPAMPEMVRALAADAGSVEFTISSYLIGFSLGQLFWGPLGDRYGRRLPIASGIILFIIGSTACALSTTVWQVIAWRAIQAAGAAAGVVLGRAMVRDLYEGERAAQMLSTLITAMAIAPLVAPLLGGQILLVASWQWIFWALVAFGVAMLIALFTIPETLPPRRRNRAGLGQAVTNYVGLLGDRAVLLNSGVGAFYYGGVFAYIAGTPFAYIDYHHVPAHLYGFLFGAGIIGIMASNVINSRLVIACGGLRMISFGGTCTLLTGLAAALAARTGFGGLWGIAVPLFLFCGMNGFIVANSIVGALKHHPQKAGAVSALVGAIQYGAGIVASATVGWLFDGTPWPMCAVVAGCGLGSATCAYLLNRTKETPTAEET